MSTEKRDEAKKNSTKVELKNHFQNQIIDYDSDGIVSPEEEYLAVIAILTAKGYAFAADISEDEELWVRDEDTSAEKWCYSMAVLNCKDRIIAMRENMSMLPQ